ncbi:two-component system response regulator [Acidihalobacter yilgarnensis]|uniref:Two-component system response regulator n=1 Tax=Acidihalobacter yilgarnensis TaxID=2819280 RepID=A0A1D8IMA6_9GAMM|nr:EAL domain-containing protein [Acidihalobacter yilgarnensis]AOU97603.1 two-component system response regulator [Acidihalobacter yilgarnensis]
MDTKRLAPIIVTTDLNEAEELISAIRNCGYAVRPTVIASEEMLREQLPTIQADLLLFDIEKSGLELSNLRAIISDAGKHLPMIALTHKPLADPMPYLESGVDDVVVASNHEHLQHVVTRTALAQTNWRALKHAQALVREAEKRCQLLLESSKDAVGYAHEGMHIYANRSYLDLFGFGDMDEIEGVPLMDLVTRQDRGDVKEFLRQYARSSEPEQTLSTHLLTVSGDEFDAELAFSPASIDGEDCTQIVIRRHDGDTKELEKQIHFLSQRDLMTGLYNRQYFMEQLKETVTAATRGLGNRAVILLALDRFESLKETFGISGSDMVLVDFGKLLEQQITEGDIACRFDGNRFIVLTHAWQAEALQAYMDRLNHAITNHICELDGRSIASPASLGGSVIDENAPDANEVLARAERAFKQANSTGGQGVIYRPREGEMSQRQLDELWSKRLREAIKENRMRLLFQPIVSLNGDHGEHYNVSMRMLDDKGQPVAAREFMPSAERSGVAKMLDRWVLHHTLKQVSSRLRENKRTILFIKLTAGSLQDPEMLPWLAEQLKENRILGDLLVFEIKTGVAVNYLRQAREFQKGLRQIHCRLALDDFGSGANPFQLLKQVPADYLKFDGTFMDDLPNSPENQETLKLLTSQAHAENRMVIAQRVEDPQVLPTLWGLGINYIQGNFLQVPSERMDYDFTAMG